MSEPDNVVSKSIDESFAAVRLARSNFVEARSYQIRDASEIESALITGGLSCERLHYGQTSHVSLLKIVGHVSNVPVFYGK